MKIIKAAHAIAGGLFWSLFIWISPQMAREEMKDGHLIKI